MFLPSEPEMLLSLINMKLRDNYSSLENMCDDLDVDYTEVMNKIEAAGLRYDSGINQLKQK